MVVILWQIGSLIPSILTLTLRTGSPLSCYLARYIRALPVKAGGVVASDAANLCHLLTKRGPFRGCVCRASTTPKHAPHAARRPMGAPGVCDGANETLDHRLDRYPPKLTRGVPCNPCNPCNPSQAFTHRLLHWGTVSCIVSAYRRNTVACARSCEQLVIKSGGSRFCRLHARPRFASGVIISTGAPRIAGENAVTELMGRAHQGAVIVNLEV